MFDKKYNKLSLNKLSLFNSYNMAKILQLQFFKVFNA